VVDPVAVSPRRRGDPGRRKGQVRRGRLLAWFTIAWNSIEGIVAIASGLTAGSIALVGFGVDSYVEVLSGAVVLWRLSKERHGEELSEAAEHRALRIIAVSFFVLGAGVAAESLRKLLTGEHPSASAVGVGLTVVSLAIMPLLARAKRKVGRELGSHALQADAGERAVRLAVGSGAGRAGAQRRLWLVVGRPGRRPRHRLRRRAGEGREAWKSETCC